jgi:hypothetical protein
MPGGDDASGRLERMVWPGQFPVAQHPAHRCRPEVKTRTDKDLRDLHLAEGRAEDPEASHEVADEVGEFVDRLGQTDKRVWPSLVETRHPGGDTKHAQPLQESQR